MGLVPLCVRLLGTVILPVVGQGWGWVAHQCEGPSRLLRGCDALAETNGLVCSLCLSILEAGLRIGGWLVDDYSCR